MAAHPNVVINNFLFLTEAADDTDVIGNLFYLNLYGKRDSLVTWNVGAGHLYHDIKPPNYGTIKVRVPQVKAGPMINLKSLHLTLNPYLGHGWERIKTPHADIDNDSWIYGITADWRWRMFNLNAKYIYQDSREGRGHFNSVHIRFVTGIHRNWRHLGVATRFDYMEHTTTKDTSFLIGPVVVF